MPSATLITNPQTSSMPSAMPSANDMYTLSHYNIPLYATRVM